MLYCTKSLFDPDHWLISSEHIKCPPSRGCVRILLTANRPNGYNNSLNMLFSKMRETSKNFLSRFDDRFRSKKGTELHTYIYMARLRCSELHNLVHVYVLEPHDDDPNAIKNDTKLKAKHGENNTCGLVLSRPKILHAAKHIIHRGKPTNRSIIYNNNNNNTATPTNFDVCAV